MYQHTLSERLDVLFRKMFPNHTEPTKRGHQILSAASGDALIEMENNPDYLTLTIIYVGWAMSFVCLPHRIDGIADHSLYSLSYGPGTDAKFNYPEFNAFIRATWPEILSLLPNSEHEIPGMGIRDLAQIIPPDQHWNPDSDFMHEHISVLLRATTSYSYK